MSSLFDRDDFNEALFFPRPDVSPPGKSCVELLVEIDGARVHVRIHPAASPSCTLLLFHGNGEVVADYDDSADRFARCGASLAVADYRGYGQSTGTPTLRRAIGDARPIAEAVRARTGQPLVVMGRSLGGAAAHELYARPIDGMIGVVLESTFVDLGRLIAGRGLVPPAAYSAEETRTFEPRTKLRAGRLPLLVLHGERDQLISPDEAQAALAAAGSTDKELVPIAGRGHNDVSFSETYWNALARFVGRLRSV